MAYYTPEEGDPLTSREWQVLTLAAQGNSNKEIGRLLSLSSRTIEIHRQRALEKLGARNTAHGVALAITDGITSLSAEVQEEGTR